MERIKEAIEKAKTQQVISSVASQAPADRGALTPPVLIAGKPPVTDAGICYQRTPVVRLDADRLEKQRIVAHQKSHPASWAFDLLRTQVLQKMDENGWRTLAVTSPTPGSGKTVVAINLAIAIAQHTNRSALLVDLDLRRPQVAVSLGLPAEVSLNQVLIGNVGIEDAMVNPGIPRLVVLPTRQAISASAEMLASGKVANLLGELRERYEDRIVVVDLPPVLAADDVLAVVPQIDCVLMVVGNGTSTRKEIEESMRRLSNVQLIGVVLNKDDAPTQNAYY
jgi:protein-tyrosine kinase